MSVHPLDTLHTALIQHKSLLQRSPPRLNHAEAAARRVVMRFCQLIDNTHTSFGFLLQTQRFPSPNINFKESTDPYLGTTRSFIKAVEARLNELDPSLAVSSVLPPKQNWQTVRQAAQDAINAERNPKVLKEMETKRSLLRKCLGISARVTAVAIAAIGVLAILNNETSAASAEAFCERNITKNTWKVGEISLSCAQVKSSLEWVKTEITQPLITFVMPYLPSSDVVVLDRAYEFGTKLTEAIKHKLSTLAPTNNEL